MPKVKEKTRPYQKEFERWSKRTQWSVGGLYYDMLDSGEYDNPYLEHLYKGFVAGIRHHQRTWSK